MAAQTEIERIYNEAEITVKYLNEAQRISDSNSVADMYRKSLLLGCASYFEHILTSALLEYVEKRTSNSSILRSIVKTKAIDRLYHSWFDWDKGNGNKFYSLLGDDFKTKMNQSLQANIELKNGEKDFVNLGNERNKLVHQNFSTFPLDMTMSEIMDQYKSAVKYVSHLISSMSAFDSAVVEVAG